MQTCTLASIPLFDRGIVRGKTTAVVVPLLVVLLCAQLNGQPSPSSAFTSNPSFIASESVPGAQAYGSSVTTGWSASPAQPSTEVAAAASFPTTSDAVHPPLRFAASQIPQPYAFPPIDQAVSRPRFSTEPTFEDSLRVEDSPRVIAQAVSGPSLLDASAIPLEGPSDLEWREPESIVVGSAIEQTPTSVVPQGLSYARQPVYGLRSLLASRLKPRFGIDQGIAYERVMFAPVALDTATTTSHIGMRVNSAQGLGLPDRLEYFWAAPGKGPQPESRVDVVTTQLRSEYGGDLAAAIVELNMRALNPVVNDNTVGFGDMAVGAKATLFSGKCTKVASIFRTYINTGPVDRGLGTGHVALEPGMLVRHQSSERTFWHGELKYWLPLGGTSGVAGDVLKTGAAVSTIWRDSDRFAILPTFEIQTYSFLFGSATNPHGIRERVNGTTAVELIPGSRWVLSSGGGLGLWEIGTSGAFTVTDAQWFDSRLLLDLRLVR